MEVGRLLLSAGARESWGKTTGLRSPGGGGARACLSKSRHDAPAEDWYKLILMIHVRSFQADPEPVKRRHPGYQPHGITI